MPTFSLSSLALSKLFLSYRAGYKVAMLERHSFSIFYHLAIEFIYLEMLVRVSTIFLFQDRIREFALADMKKSLIVGPIQCLEFVKI